jgi:hypothetical protein
MPVMRLIARPAPRRLCALLALALLAAGCNSGAQHDPPVFVPWNRIGDIELGESRAQVEHDYGSAGYHVLQRYGDNIEGYYALHGTKVVVIYYGDRVGELEFATPYYRTKDGFGVGSKIPLGPCHRTVTSPCEHRWHGFIWNAFVRETPCICWVKVGLGAKSLPATGENFEKPWFLIYTRGGRAAYFYFALKFVD